MGYAIVGLDVDRAAPLGPPPSPNRAEHPYAGTMHYQGVLVYVENPKGSIREGTDNNGQPWKVQVKHDYGELPGTIGADGDPIDVYVGPNPTAPMAFVMHQRHYFGSEYAVPGTYDEDKVMLGFNTRREALEAYAAHYNHPVWTPGVSVVAVDELRDMIEDGDLAMGAALTKSLPKPPGKGWQPIPKGKKGGWRRKSPSGGWQYRYPDPKAGKVKLASKKERRKAMRADLEPDPTATTQDISPGDIVEVGGRQGRYKWVPGAKKEGKTTTSVQSMSTGSVELVRKKTLVPLRKETEKPKTKKKKPPPPPPPKAKVVRDTDQVRDKKAIPEDWPKKPKGPQKKKTDKVSDKARKAKPWPHSTAKPGSALEAVENGSLPLQKFRSRHMKRSRLTIHVPDALKNKLVQELTGVFHQAARNVAKSFRPPIPITVPGTGELSEQYKELVSGAQLGFVMALTNYRGGRAFVPVVQDYANTYALQAARSTRRGYALKERDLRALKGFIAARSRAANITRTRKGREPTDQEVMDSWYLTKRMIFTGRGNKLGSYTAEVDGEEKIIDQSHEQVPEEDWQVKTPAGKPTGKKYPGKKSLIKKMKRLLQGEDVPDDDWLQRPPSNLLPHHDDLAMNAGTALHIRQEVQDILDEMKQPYGQALAMRFGMHVPEDEDPKALQAKKKAELQAMARSRDLKVSGNKADLRKRILEWSADQNRPGTKGYQASASEVAEALGFTAEMSSKASAAAKVRRLWKQGIGSFRLKADKRDGAIAEYVDMWSDDLTEDPEFTGTKQGPLLPSQSYLADRFGNNERAVVYQTMLRAGKGQSTAKKLEQERDGKLSPEESDKLRAEYHKQRRKEAQAAFDRYRAVTADPDKVADIGPETGTPGEAEWLYTGNVLQNYMRSKIRKD